MKFSNALITEAKGSLNEMSAFTPFFSVAKLTADALNGLLPAKYHMPVLHVYDRKVKSISPNAPNAILSFEYSVEMKDEEMNNVVFVSVFKDGSVKAYFE